MIELCSEYLSFRCIWLFFLVTPLMRFRVNPQSIVAWMSWKSLLEAVPNSEGEVTATGLVPRTNDFLNKHWTISPKWPNDWDVFWVLTCTVHLTVCSCQVTYAFQSESTPYSYLNVKELLARSRRELWMWSDCNCARTHNHLVLKRTFNHWAKLAKWLGCVLSIYLCGAFDCCSCHVTYAFQSESTLSSCLYVKKLLARSMW